MFPERECQRRYLPWSPRALLKASLRGFESPAQCLTVINDLLCEDNDSCVFITLFFGVLDLGTGEFKYSNAGHNPPRLIRSNTEVEELPRDPRIWFWV